MYAPACNLYPLPGRTLQTLVGKSLPSCLSENNLYNNRYVQHATRTSPRHLRTTSPLYLLFHFGTHAPLTQTACIKFAQSIRSALNSLHIRRYLRQWWQQQRRQRLTQKFSTPTPNFHTHRINSSEGASVHQKYLLFWRRRRRAEKQMLL